MKIETVNELIASLESAGELSIRETKVMALAKAYQQLAAENARLSDIAKGGAFVMQKALMKYEFGVGMTMQAEDFIRDARSKTPATDAFLAEVRAQGVEMLNTQFKKCTGMLYADSVVSTAEHFAKQLREGADK